MSRSERRRLRKAMFARGDSKIHLHSLTLTALQEAAPPQDCTGSIDASSVHAAYLRGKKATLQADRKLNDMGIARIRKARKARKARLVVRTIQ